MCHVYHPVKASPPILCTHTVPLTFGFMAGYSVWCPRHEHRLPIQAQVGTELAFGVSPLLGHHVDSSRFHVLRLQSPREAGMG